MKRTALYSLAVPRQPIVRNAVEDGIPSPETPPASKAAPGVPVAIRARLVRLFDLHRVSLLLVLIAALSGLLLERLRTETAAPLTQEAIDYAVRQTLEKRPLPAQTAKAFEAISPSIVRVMGFEEPKSGENKRKFSSRQKSGNESKPESDDDGSSIGTGVVITEKGAILTNLHVVSSARRILLRFHDGTESDAVVTGFDVNNDLAVIQPKKLPDDLQAATLVSTGDLRPGDAVLAVGFPFGFGPSASAGVVSGLKREFRSKDGKQVLSNLIQFDAAANPGNSGGPLVNMEGEVLGIVTAILNPTQQRFFVGLAFAVPIENAASAVGIHPF